MRPLVLIVEDNFLLAVQLAEFVEKRLNAKPIIVSKVSEALAVAATSISLALLDIEILEGNSFPVARQLLANNVPFIFVSGNSADTLPFDLKHVPFVSKPYVDNALVQLARSMLSRVS